MLINLDDFSRMLKIERNYSDNTISAYLSDLKSFNTFLEKKYAKKEEVQKEEVQKEEVQKEEENYENLEIDLDDIEF